MTQQHNDSKHSVAVHYFGLLTDYLARIDWDARPILQQVGLQPDSLSDPNGRVPFQVFADACELAAEQLDDPYLGLRLGQIITPQHLGSHGFAMASCSNARELLSQHQRFSALTIDAGFSEYVMEGGLFVRRWCSNLSDGQSLGKLQNELNKSSVLTLARTFFNQPERSPLWVSFQHPKPENVALYEEVFNCPVKFSQPHTAIAVDVEWLNLPLAHGNPELRRVMEDFCNKLVSQLGDALDPPWLALARRSVLNAFSLGLPAVADVAKEAGMSEDEFKKALSERGSSFRAFVDELRRGLALGYARDPDFSLVEIACLLGFSEQSAFQRAFKRWTGQTPGAYRASV